MDVSRETLIEQYFPDTARIMAYAEFLAGPGVERGLLGPREADRIWERHIFNCLPVTTLLKEGSILFDVGSGAGLPGIVIALARPDVHVVLIEPLERRVEFLKEAVAGLNIEVIRGKAQDVRATAHYVTARAVAPLEKLKKMTWHLVKTGGSLMAIKGKSAEIEMKSLPLSILHEVELAGIEPGRIVEVRKGA